VWKDVGANLFRKCTSVFGELRPKLDALMLSKDECGRVSRPVFRQWDYENRRAANCWLSVKSDSTKRVRNPTKM
jgi:hypothetical protein